jgi:ATP-dependent DNA helicase DinG
VFDVAERMAALSEHDVVWVADRERLGREIRVAPLSVAGLMRSAVFGSRTVVLTSATLKLGGEFTPLAASVGLRAAERQRRPEWMPEPVDDPGIEQGGDGTPAGNRATTGPAVRRDSDVGSPFAYRSRASAMWPAPCRRPAGTGCRRRRWPRSPSWSGPPAGAPWACSARAGRPRRPRPRPPRAAQADRAVPGDAQLSELTRRFIADEQASLFGTLSLWQGVDVPGRPAAGDHRPDPVPPPDEPLTPGPAAGGRRGRRQRVHGRRRHHAALLLAQGAGRLIRRLTDRGVVAVLDSRLVTARYGSFLQASMPDMWPTTDREVAIAALRRLAGEAEPVGAASATR